MYKKIITITNENNKYDKNDSDNNHNKHEDNNKTMHAKHVQGMLPNKPSFELSKKKTN